jgi:hypothetical protein
MKVKLPRLKNIKLSDYKIGYSKPSDKKSAHPLLCAAKRQVEKQHTRGERLVPAAGITTP